MFGARSPVGRQTPRPRAELHLGHTGCFFPLTLCTWQCSLQLAPELAETWHGTFNAFISRRHDWRLFQGDEKADIRSLMCQLGFLEPEQESPSTSRVYFSKDCLLALVLLRMLCVDSAGDDA